MALDLDLVFLARRLVLGLDVQDAVDVDVEGDFDLRRATGGGRDALQLELAERAVVLGEFAFALQDVDFDAGLVVGGGGEGFALGGGDRGVARDHDGHDAAVGFDAHRERGDIEHEDVFDFAGGDAALNGGADGDGFIGVDGLVAFLAEDFLDHLSGCAACGSNRRRGGFRRSDWPRAWHPEGLDDRLAAAFA